MEKNPLNKGVLTENCLGVGSVTRGMVRERAIELAAINGHSLQDVSKSDWEQAKRELMGGARIYSQEAICESMPEAPAFPNAGTCSVSGVFFLQSPPTGTRSFWAGAQTS